MAEDEIIRLHPKTGKMRFIQQVLLFSTCTAALFQTAAAAAAERVSIDDLTDDLDKSFVPGVHHEFARGLIRRTHIQAGMDPSKIPDFDITDKTQLLTWVFGKLDTDHDGVLSEDEFDKMFQRPAERDENDMRIHPDALFKVIGMPVDMDQDQPSKAMYQYYVHRNSERGADGVTLDSFRTALSDHKHHVNDTGHVVHPSDFAEKCDIVKALALVSGTLPCIQELRAAALLCDINPTQIHALECLVSTASFRACSCFEFESIDDVDGKSIPPHKLARRNIFPVLSSVGKTVVLNDFELDTLLGGVRSTEVAEGAGVAEAEGIIATMAEIIAGLTLAEVVIIVAVVILLIILAVYGDFIFNGNSEIKPDDFNGPVQKLVDALEHYPINYKIWQTTSPVPHCALYIYWSDQCDGYGFGHRCNTCSHNGELVNSDSGYDIWHPSTRRCNLFQCQSQCWKINDVDCGCGLLKYPYAFKGGFSKYNYKDIPVSEVTDCLDMCEKDENCFGFSIINNGDSIKHLTCRLGQNRKFLVIDSKMTNAAKITPKQLLDDAKSIYEKGCSGDNRVLGEAFKSLEVFYKSWKQAYSSFSNILNQITQFAGKASTFMDQVNEFSDYISNLVNSQTGEINRQLKSYPIFHSNEMIRAFSGINVALRKNKWSLPRAFVVALGASDMSGVVFQPLDGSSTSVLGYGGSRGLGDAADIFNPVDINQALRSPLCTTAPTDVEVDGTEKFSWMKIHVVNIDRGDGVIHESLVYTCRKLNNPGFASRSKDVIMSEAARPNGDCWLSERHRTLIDSGVRGAGPTMESYIRNNLNGRSFTDGREQGYYIDEIVISHFDIDHFEGVTYLIEDMNRRNVLFAQNAPIIFNIWLDSALRNAVGAGDMVTACQALWYPISSGFIRQYSLATYIATLNEQFRSNSEMFTDFGDEPQYDPDGPFDRPPENFNKIATFLYHAARNGFQFRNAIAGNSLGGYLDRNSDFNTRTNVVFPTGLAMQTVFQWDKFCGRYSQVNVNNLRRRDIMNGNFTEADFEDDIGFEISANASNVLEKRDYPNPRAVGYLKNYISIVHHTVVNGDVNILSTGDASGRSFSRFLQTMPLPIVGGRYSVDLYKIPHHGSSKTGTEEMVSQILTDIYVISGKTTSPTDKIKQPNAEFIRWIIANHFEQRNTVAKIYITNYYPTTLDQFSTPGLRPEDCNYRIYALANCQGCNSGHPAFVFETKHNREFNVPRILPDGVYDVPRNLAGAPARGYCRARTMTVTD
ncbi:hypothetical protein HDU97_002454 [Phlyctochytrium planicorne]|nr:hypothetical protein HDU97_002454 [Phlyctochytrium planicorne]